MWLKVVTLTWLVMLSLSCQKRADQFEALKVFVSPSPVFQSPLDLAADPSIVRNEDTLLLYYTADLQTIAVVISTDNGQTWQPPDGDRSRDYPALKGRPDDWDQTLETADVVRVHDHFLMYYTGYREGEADNDHVENYEIGLARSKDGIHFFRDMSKNGMPVVRRDVSGDFFDRHALTSPGVVYTQGRYYMIYAGWNVTDDWTGPNAGIRILGAHSEDGISWSKQGVLIGPDEITYSPDINEASLMLTQEGNWYIPFSTDVSIGIARATTFSGPYDIYPSTIINPGPDWAGEVTAPDGIIEAGKIRLWYHGVKTPEYWPWSIGYAETAYPIQWP